MIGCAARIPAGLLLEKCEMAVFSDTFGGLRLTGEDAAKFERQVRYGRTTTRAIESARRGSKLAAALLRDGEVRIDSAKP